MTTSPFEFYAENIVWDMSNWRRAFLYSQPVYYGHEVVRLEAVGLLD